MRAAIVSSARVYWHGDSQRLSARRLLEAKRHGCAVGAGPTRARGGLAWIDEQRPKTLRVESAEYPVSKSPYFGHVVQPFQAIILALSSKLAPALASPFRRYGSELGSSRSPCPVGPSLLLSLFCGPNYQGLGVKASSKKKKQSVLVRSRYYGRILVRMKEAEAKTLFADDGDMVDDEYRRMRQPHKVNKPQ